jgi:hypothetical protein
VRTFFSFFGQKDLRPRFLPYVCRLKLKALHRFTSTATAVEDISSLQNGKLGKGLKKFLTDEVVDKGKGKESLVVIDPHLGSSIISS